MLLLAIQICNILSQHIGPNKVVVKNGHYLEVKSAGNTQLQYNIVLNSFLKLAGLLHVSNITRNLMPVSKFVKVNHVFFEFHPNECFVKSQAFKQVLLEGFLNENGLYYFNNLTLASSKRNLSHKSNTLGLVANNVLFSNKHINRDQLDKLDPTILSMWHSRLGHAHLKAIHRIL